MKRRHKIVGFLLLTMGLLFAPSAQAAAPVNDDFPSAQDLGSGLTASVTNGTNVDATKEQGEPDHAGDQGGASVWYRWTAPGSGLYRVDTCNSGFDTLLAVYTGSAVNGLTELASNDQGCGSQSKVVVSASAGATYEIAIDGYRGSGFFADEGSIDLRLRPVSRPSNDNFANPQDLGSGSTATASGSNVDATRETAEPNHAGDPGGASVWYRWTAPSSGQVRIATCTSDFDTLLAVYTGSSLASLTQVASNDQGCDANQSRVVFSAVAGVTYRIAVDGYSSGGATGAQEGQIALELKPPSPPGNDDFANAIDLGTSTDLSSSGTSLDATKQAGEPNHAGDPGGASVWYRWTSLGVGRIKIDTCDTAFDTLLAVYTGSSVNNLTSVTSSDQACNDQSKVAFDVLPGMSYWIAIDGDSANGAKPPGQGRIDFNLQETHPPANDNFANATNLGNTTATTFGVDNRDATKESGEPNHAGDPGGASVWYRWTAPSSGPVRLDACESFYAFDTLIGVYTGSGANAVTTVAANDDSCAFGQSLIVFQASAGATYRIAVDGTSYGGSQAAQEGFINIDLKVLNPPANDAFANAQNLGSSTTASASGTNVDATKEIGEPNHAGDPGGASVWYRWTAPSSGEARVDTCDSDFDTMLAVYRGGAIGSLTKVDRGDAGCGGALIRSTVQFPAVAGETYFIAVDGDTHDLFFPPKQGAIQLDLYPAPPPTPLPPPLGIGTGTATIPAPGPASSKCKKGSKRKRARGKAKCVKKRQS